MKEYIVEIDGKKVTAQEGETQATHEDLALRLVTQVCEELKVQYRVLEKKDIPKK